MAFLVFGDVVDGALRFNGLAILDEWRAWGRLAEGKVKGSCFERGVVEVMSRCRKRRKEIEESFIPENKLLMVM